MSRAPPGAGVAVRAGSLLAVALGAGDGLVEAGSLLAVALGEGGGLVEAGALLAVALGEAGGLVELGVAVLPPAHDPRSAALARTAPVCIARCRKVLAGHGGPDRRPSGRPWHVNSLWFGAPRSWPMVPRV